MGQCVCCARLKAHPRRRSSQYRHKRFEFTPTRSWKFRDSAIRTEFQEMSVQNQDALDEDLSPLSGPSPTFLNGNNGRRDSDEEDGAAAGEIRKGGRLVFSEDADDSNSQISVEPSGDTAVAMETEGASRDRSWSNNSEKMGRFEVWTLDEVALLDPTENEESRLITDGDNNT